MSRVVLHWSAQGTQIDAMVAPNTILFVESYASGGYRLHDARVQHMLGLEHPPGKFVGSITGTDGHRRLRDDRPFVVPLVDEVHRRTR